MPRRNPTPLAMLSLLRLVSACEAEPHSPTEPSSRAHPTASITRRGAEARPGEPSASSSAPRADIAVPRIAMPRRLDPPNARPLATTQADALEVFDSYGFPVYPSLTHYCKQRLYQAGGQRTTLDGFVSADSPEPIARFYRERLGERGLESKGPTTSWRLPAGSPAPVRTLSVAPIGLASNAPRACPTPDPSAKTVVTLERAE